MKVKLLKHFDKKVKGKYYYRSRITIPKLLMEQCNLEKKEYLNIAMGFQSNGKPYLMITEVDK